MASYHNHSGSAGLGNGLGHADLLAEIDDLKGRLSQAADKKRELSMKITNLECDLDEARAQASRR